MLTENDFQYRQETDTAVDANRCLIFKTDTKHVLKIFFERDHINADYEPDVIVIDADELPVPEWSDIYSAFYVIYKNEYYSIPDVLAYAGQYFDELQSEFSVEYEKYVENRMDSFEEAEFGMHMDYLHSL